MLAHSITQELRVLVGNAEDFDVVEGRELLLADAGKDDASPGRVQVDTLCEGVELVGV